MKSNRLEELTQNLKLLSTEKMRYAAIATVYTNVTTTLY